jgi:DAK2 domain fusion protein YloV
MSPDSTGATAAGDDESTIGADALVRAFAGGTHALIVQRDALNAINVFPVPDGDTGTNMSLTMTNANNAVIECKTGPEPPTVAGIAKAAANGALMGARGNSGVILSQILTGFAALNADVTALDGAAVADGFERGRTAAYAVISNPREGTILSAITAVVATCKLSAADGGAALDVLRVAAAAAQEATDRTPEQLPVLKEAGVVDAGAQGLAVMLDGMVRALTGEAAPTATDLGAIDTSWLSATRRVHDDGARAGFCTEFVVSGESLDAEAMRARLGTMGESLLVVGSSEVVRVHIHADKPDDVFDFARTLGEVSREKVEDMEAQFQNLAAGDGAADGGPAAAEGIAVVAVAAGGGIEELFRSLGAAEVVRGGQTMNPSAGDIHEAVIAAHASDVIILPNNKNIVLAAEQATGTVSDIKARVVPSRSIPQGVAAVIAFNADLSIDDNVDAMNEAIAAVMTGEITLAARSTKVGGVEVQEGQPIGLIDGELVLADDTIAGAARACVERMLEGREGAIVTLYRGDGAPAEDAERLAEILRSELSCEVEVVDGGQPHYPYLIGVE